MVDALAITGDEGRSSLRKVTGSWQTSFDPWMSEWGNPALNKWLSAKVFMDKQTSWSWLFEVGESFIEGHP
jgi:hypothetical protein